MVYDMTHMVPSQNIALGRYYLQDLNNVENEDYATFDFDKRYQARMGCETPISPQSSGSRPAPPPTPAPRRRTTPITHLDPSELVGLSREERRRRRRATLKYRTAHATRERFDSAYKPKGLNNWELPKWCSSKPKQRKGYSQIIANERGHLLNRNLLKNDSKPWGNFRNTFQLPDKINKHFVAEHNNRPQENTKLSNFSNTCYDSKDLGFDGNDVPCPTKYRHNDEVSDPNRSYSFDKKDVLDLEYTPGDLTSFKSQHHTRDFLLKDKYNQDNNIKPDLKLDTNYLGDHGCKTECEPPPVRFISSLPQTSTFEASPCLPQILDSEITNKFKIDTNEDYLKIEDTTKMLGSQAITQKPNERCPSPIVPAYANFELAKRMHSNNLEHQPLPDCVADLAFRKLQITGNNPGLALDIEPFATGVGVKTHNAGPTHCTKMKVYRPKTSGVVPRAFNNNIARTHSATPTEKRIGAMDLAIYWDYKPPLEPIRPVHIDGSNDSAGPAVFTYVKTPRDDAIMNTGKSSGVFTNTLGETGFFDKDILRRNTDFERRNISANEFLDDNLCPKFTTAPNCISRDNSVFQRLPETHLSKQYKSTPNIFVDQEYKALRNKYLRTDGEFPKMCVETGCKRSGVAIKARSKLCHKIAPETSCCCMNACQPKRLTSNAVFRAGIPRYDAAGNSMSTDSGCSVGNKHSQRVLVVPRPRNPYRKRSYDITTLVPPFQSYGGGAGEAGYPEHWRLSSVYQHSFKPLEYRRKSLLQSVYK